jgi:hypothetical protein
MKAYTTYIPACVRTYTHTHTHRVYSQRFCRRKVARNHNTPQLKRRR